MILFWVFRELSALMHGQHMRCQDVWVAGLLEEIELSYR